MSNNEWKVVRKEQHPALPDQAYSLEINTRTLEFRTVINGQAFTGKDGADVISRAGAYLRTLPVPGNWQSMIELAHYGTHMEANRWWIRVEDNGAIVRHPWTGSPATIAIMGITQVRFHSNGFDLVSPTAPPCMHKDGLSTYYHLPHSVEVWERAQAVARTFNGMVDRLSSFLKAVSAPSEDWAANFLEQWGQLSRAFAGPNEIQGEAVKGAV